MTWYLKGTDPFYGGTSQGHLFDKGFFGVGKGDEVLGLQQLILGPNFCLTLEACSEDRRLASEVSLEGDPYSTQLSTQVTEDNLEGERESNALLAAPSSPLAPRKRGRPRKLRPPFCPPEKQDRGIQYGPKKRGRKPKGLPPHTDSPATEGSLSNLQSEAENSGQREALGRYFTRATKVWLLGKVLGLEFDGTDAQAVEGLDRELKSFLLGGIKYQWRESGSHEMCVVKNLLRKAQPEIFLLQETKLDQIKGKTNRISLSLCSMNWPLYLQLGQLGD